MRHLHSLARSSRRIALGTGVLALALAACDRADILEIVGDVRTSTGGAPGPGVTSIPFESFSEAVGDKAASERRVLIKTREAYVSFFGHAPPAVVDLPRDWVIFYAAGKQPTGGYAARLQSLVLAPIGGEKVLQAVTVLDSPGKDCAVTSEETTPFALVRFAAQTGVASIDFSRSDTASGCGGTPNPCAAAQCPTGSTCVVRQVQCVKAPCPPIAACVVVDPPPTDPCATVRCASGTHCVPEQVECVKAPCPPVARCMPDETVVHCGGFAGRPCPGQGSCADDPTDSCDPNKGGADCGGICSCSVNKTACAKGLVFDNSPAICACVSRDGGGEKCGDKTCATGQICCNASCGGVCTAKGNACSLIACPQ